MRKRIVQQSTFTKETKTIQKRTRHTQLRQDSGKTKKKTNLCSWPLASFVAATFLSCCRISRESFSCFDASWRRSCYNDEWYVTIERMQKAKQRNLRRIRSLRNNQKPFSFYNGVSVLHCWIPPIEELLELTDQTSHYVKLLRCRFCRCWIVLAAVRKRSQQLRTMYTVRTCSALWEGYDRQDFANCRLVFNQCPAVSMETILCKARAWPQ